MQIERDGWILLLARDPERVTEWLQENALLADPAFQQLYRDDEQAVDWDPTDSRLEELADAILRFTEQRSGDEVARHQDLDDQTVIALLASHFGDVSSPALERLAALTEEQRASRG